MTEKLKYKVGDKVLVEAEITRANPTSVFPYDIRLFGIDMDDSFSSDIVEDNVIHPSPKLKITQEVMDWYESNKISHWGIRDYIAHTSEDIDRWIDNSLQNGCAFATLITYGPEAVEVEKEKRYVVILKVTGQSLYKPKDDNIGIYFSSALSSRLTKQELIDASFEGVFDNPMFEVEEVE